MPSERELKEIFLSLYYAKYLAHGTDGHNRLLLLAKMSQEAGYALMHDCDLYFKGTCVLSLIK